MLISSSFAFPQEWKALHTVRLRIDKFPKRKKENDNKSKKKIGLTKNDIKEFFKPLCYKSFRQNNKNRFEYYVGFETEAAIKQAIRKDGSYLRKLRLLFSNMLTYFT